jgi:metal-dependent hydrolase (beta-lactamase superfamily II)
MHVILDGMHLTVSMFGSLTPRTINEMYKLKPKFIISCHCLGLKTISEIIRNMSDAFIQITWELNIYFEDGCYY